MWSLVCVVITVSTHCSVCMNSGNSKTEIDVKKWCWAEGQMCHLEQWLPYLQTNEKFVYTYTHRHSVGHTSITCCCYWFCCVYLQQLFGIQNDPYAHLVRHIVPPSPATKTCRSFAIMYSTFLFSSFAVAVLFSFCSFDCDWNLRSSVTSVYTIINICYSEKSQIKDQLGNKKKHKTKLETKGECTRKQNNKTNYTQASHFRWQSNLICVIIKNQNAN